jgi:hypothetical protein
MRKLLRKPEPAANRSPIALELWRGSSLTVAYRLIRSPRPTGSDSQRRALRMEMLAVRVLGLDALVRESLVKRVNSIANDVAAQ